MDFPKIKLEIEGNVGTLTFNHPEALNPVGREMLEGLGGALDAVEDESNGLRCLILTGAGRGFCSGANLGETSAADQMARAASNARPPDFGEGLEKVYHPLLRRLRNLDMPLVTAVNGPAAGIGMSFALMGDMILAARSAFFLQAFRRIGLVPDGGSTWLLPRLVGMARARELALLGERLPAEKAYEWGLVNRLYEDDQLMDEAKKLAKALAGGPTIALNLIRRAFWESTDNSYEEQLNLERQSQKIAGRTQDRTEGVMAFLEKRPAKFQGK